MRPRKPENVACCTARFPTAAAASLAHAINHPGRQRHQAGVVLVRKQMAQTHRDRDWQSPVLRLCFPTRRKLALHRPTPFCGPGRAEIPGISRGGRIPLQRSQRLSSPPLAHRVILPSGTRKKTHGSGSMVFTLCLVAPGAEHWPKKCHTRRHSMWLLFPAGKAARAVQGVWSQPNHTGKQLEQSSCEVAGAAEQHRKVAGAGETVGAGLGQHRRVDAKESSSKMCGTEQGQI